MLCHSLELRSRFSFHVHAGVPLKERFSQHYLPRSVADAFPVGCIRERDVMSCTFSGLLILFDFLHRQLLK
jgi:hypothetical protein